MENMPQFTQKSSSLPLEAYRFFPSEAERYYKDPKGKVQFRRIFLGNIEFNQSEKQKLAELLDHIKTIPELNSIVQENREYWCDGNLIRFHQATNFDKKKTAECMRLHQEYRAQYTPIQHNPQKEQLLKETGLIYLSGRDHRYRPFIVLRARVLKDLKLPQQELLDLMAYFLENVIEQHTLPGQIENWNVILDLNGLGVTNFPYDDLKKAMGFMQNNYRGRLFKCYMVNAPMTFSIVWTMAKAFLEGTTSMKISMTGKICDKNIWLHTNPSQVEIIYGGKADNFQTGNYWPPIVVSQQVFVSQDDEGIKLIVNEEQYRQMGQQGQLRGHKVAKN